jgi:hypothetical protein
MNEAAKPSIQKISEGEKHTRWGAKKTVLNQDGGPGMPLRMLTDLPTAVRTSVDRNGRGQDPGGLATPTDNGTFPSIARQREVT